jgi:hypothetical protein
MGMSSAGVKGPSRAADAAVGSPHIWSPNDSTDTNRREASIAVVSTPRTARLLEQSSATTRTPPSLIRTPEDDFMGISSRNETAE